MTEEMLATWERLNAAAARSPRAHGKGSVRGPAAVAVARNAFKGLIEACRPRAPFEKGQFGGVYLYGGRSPGD